MPSHIFLSTQYGLTLASSLSLRSILSCSSLILRSISNCSSVFGGPLVNWPCCQRDEATFVLGLPPVHFSVAIATQGHAIGDIKRLLWELLYGFHVVGMDVSRVPAQNALSSKTAEDGLFPSYVFRSFAE